VTENRQRKPIAFVILPFAQDFGDVYIAFIKASLETAGFEVMRADDIRSQQNILKDIVTGIAQSDLIVADLTDANPNVYYELEIAHALGKRVVLLIQDLDELPFDLRAYRVILYDTHFARIEAARKELLSVAEGTIRGQLPFGNPVTDFLPGETGLLPSAPRPPSTKEEPSECEQEELGFLDHLVNLEEGFEKVTEIVTEVSGQMTSTSEATTRITERLQALSKNPDSRFARDARTLIIGLAQQIGDFSRFLGEKNESYTRTLYDLRDSMEFVLSAQQPKSDEEKARLRSFLETLQTAQINAERAREVINTLTETVKSTPRIERTYNRSADHMVRELARYADNIEQTVSVIARAREVGESRLN